MSQLIYLIMKLLNWEALMRIMSVPSATMRMEQQRFLAVLWAATMMSLSQSLPLQAMIKIINLYHAWPVMMLQVWM